MEARSTSRRRLTRRHVLKTGAAALGAGTGVLNAPPVLEAQSTQAPAVVTGAQTGRSFRGLVRPGTTLDVQEMRLLPIDPRQVVILSLAVAPCYTIVRGALSTGQSRRAEVPNHCGFGVVEADTIQLAIYLLGLALETCPDLDRVGPAGTTVIIQPNARAEPVRSFDYSFADLREIKRRVTAALPVWERAGAFAGRPSQPR